MIHLEPREVERDFIGPHLIFSVEGDAGNVNPDGCWSYVGRQGAQGGKAGQTVNLGSDECYNIGTVLHNIMHSLGKYTYMVIVKLFLFQFKEQDMNMED